VRDLLDLGQLERSGFSIATEPVDLATVAERAHERFAGRARELGVTLEAQAEGSAVVQADPGRLLQAVSNLVESGIDLQMSQPSAAATRSWSVMGSNGLGITPATPSDA